MPILPPPSLIHLFTLRCAVSAPLEIGQGPYGRRRCVPIVSGSVSGEYITGEVVPGGADFMYIPAFLIPDAMDVVLMRCRLVEEDQTTHVNTNYVIKSDDGAYLYIRYARAFPLL